MNIESLVKRQILRRKVDGIAAALQPFKDHGRIAVEAFQRHLVNTHRAGLMNAVNMDTGYVNYLSDTEKQDVLRWTRDALGKDMPFIAGWVHRGPVRPRCLAVSPANGRHRSMPRNTNPVSDQPAAWKDLQGKSRGLSSGRAGTPTSWLSSSAVCSRPTRRCSTRKHCCA
jgi:hypothetical protein